MKHIRIATCLAFLFIFPMTLKAQETPDPKHDRREDHSEKIDKLRIAFITTELDLTSAEAEKFWPVYNEMDNKLKELRKTERMVEREVRDSLETLTNEEAKQKRNTLFENQEKEIAIRKEYTEKISKIIGDKRTLKLLSLEHEFRRELLERLREERPDHRGQEPRPHHPPARNGDHDKPKR